MPSVVVNGAMLHYWESGNGPATVVFAHGLLFNARMFADQIAALDGEYRCIAFDFRGHGESQHTPSGYDVETMSADAAALLSALGAAPAHFVGCSMGGFAGIRLAARAPHLLRSLVLVNTVAEAEPAASAARYRLLNAVARRVGFWPAIGPVMRIMFGRTFLADPARAERSALWRAQLLANRAPGVHQAVEAVCARPSAVPLLAAVRVPTLVVTGDEDTATPPACAQRIRDGVAGARLLIVPAAGHTVGIERPAALNDALRAFFAQVDGVGSERATSSQTPAGSAET
jgi:3-oxoadipate enol-lactonase